MQKVDVVPSEGQRQAYTLYKKYVYLYTDPLGELQKNLMLYLKDEDKVNKLIRYVKDKINTGQPFLDKQSELQKQIDRVKIKLNFYRKWDDKHFDDKFDRLPEKEKERIRKISFSFPWNYYNDMLEELENQLRENFMEYQDWHLEKSGWCAY